MPRKKNDPKNYVFVKDEPVQEPVSVWVFWFCIAGLAVLVCVIGFVVARYVWTRELVLWEIFALVVLTGVAITVALVVNKAIPTNSRSFLEWRRPVAIGALAYSVLLVGLAVPLAFVPLLGKDPAPPEPDRVLASTRLAGLWGESSACEVTYDVKVINRAIRIERLAEQLPPYLLIGTIKADNEDSLSVAVREPRKAAGQTLDLRLEDDGMTRRLVWDEVAMDVPLKLHPCGDRE